MIDIEKWTDFLNEFKLTSEEGFLIFSIHETEEYPALSAKMQIYIARNKGMMKYNKWIDRMVRNGILVNSNVPGEYKVNMLSLTEDFKKKLIVDEEEAYKEVRRIYPKKLYINKGRKNEEKRRTFGNKERDIQFYKQYVLKGSLRENHFKFVHFVEEYFQERDYADMNFEHFCERWDTWLEDRIEELENETENIGRGGNLAY